MKKIEIILASAILCSASAIIGYELGESRNRPEYIEISQPNEDGKIKATIYSRTGEYGVITNDSRNKEISSILSME